METESGFYRKFMNVIRVAALVFFLFGTISCAALLRDYGRISPSETATGDFERFAVKGGFRYYVSGSDLHPNAILGLRSDERLDPKTLWREVVMTPVAMKEFVEGMNTRAGHLGLYLYGFELTIPDGRPVGVWYSIPQARTMLRVNDDGTLWIETPDIDTWEKYEVRFRRP